MNTRFLPGLLLTPAFIAAASLGTPATSEEPAPRPAQEIRLFNGRDLSGWTFCLADPNAKMEDVWSVDPAQGIIICKGKPLGYIRTLKDYTNYVLRLGW